MKLIFQIIFQEARRKLLCSSLKIKKMTNRYCESVYIGKLRTELKRKLSMSFFILLNRRINYSILITNEVILLGILLYVSQHNIIRGRKALI